MKGRAKSFSLLQEREVREISSPLQGEARRGIEQAKDQSSEVASDSLLTPDPLPLLPVNHVSAVRARILEQRNQNSLEHLKGEVFENLENRVNEIDSHLEELRIREFLNLARDNQTPTAVVIPPIAVIPDSPLTPNPSPLSLKNKLASNFGIEDSSASENLVLSERCIKQG